MYRNIWSNAHRSVCSLTFLANGERISSGSGFVVNNRLITNNHVIQVPSATHVRLRFVGDDGYSETAAVTDTVDQFSGHLLDGEPESDWDFAILDLNWDEFQGVPSLDLADANDVEIGQPVATLGYHFEQANLSINTAILSSTFVQAGVTYLQIDGSVNQGNSGGPLIDVETSCVIGTVTRKATGLTQQFDNLLASFEHNISAFESAQSIIRVGAVDPLQALTISQRQMARVAVEMKRSANVGIGFAYAIRRVRDSLEALG